MRLKLFINGCEYPEDYKLLSTTISTVASLRETAVLRFTSERLVLISTPKSSSNNVRNLIQGDSGQLWCTVPSDAFKLYDVESVRELNTITMEYNCEYLHSVFKRYDRAMSQGSSSDMVIRLNAMPEWNQQPHNDNGSKSKKNLVCALRITFEEIIHTQAMDPSREYGSSATSNIMDSSKTVMHSFKVPVRLLYKAQDASIMEPTINYTQIQIDKLPSFTSSFGPAFLNFFRRVERYSSVNHIRLSGLRKEEDDSYNDRLAIIVDETAWNVEISWNGPLDAVLQSGADNRMSQEDAPSNDPSAFDSNRGEPDDEHDDVQIEDSEIADTRDIGNRSDDVADRLVDVSAMVENAERESSQTHEVFIRLKDWKVCHKLYAAFEEVILAISHDASCILHCSLDRSGVENENNDAPKIRGQIIYYMVRSKPL